MFIVIDKYHFDAYGPFATAAEANQWAEHFREKINAPRQDFEVLPLKPT